MLQNAYMPKEKYVERTLSPTPDVRQRDSLMMQLEVAQKCLAELQECIAMFEERLAPILPISEVPKVSQGFQTGTDSDAKFSSVSTAVVYSASIIDSINKCIYRINSLRNNVEL